MKTNLSIDPPEVMDNSMISTHMRCPRLFLYQYMMHRSPEGESYPIRFGIAYHRYRELLERQYLNEEEEGDSLDWHNQALEETMDEMGEDPPAEHRYVYLNKGRLRETCDLAFEIWKREKHEGRIEVLETEQAFDLVLPSGKRFGGRFDQIVEWNGRLWVRDFKTTSRKYKNWAERYKVDHQMTGYCWAVQQLSGREVKGVLIELVHNTKTIAPNFEHAPITRGTGAFTQWEAAIEKELADIDRNLEDLETRGVLGFPQRTTACGDYGGCYFRHACALESSRMLDSWMRQHTVESRWDFMNPDGEEGTPE